MLQTSSSAPPGLSRSQLERQVCGALKQAIDAHGPITRENVSSAAKRVVSMLKRADS